MENHKKMPNMQKKIRTSKRKQNILPTMHKKVEKMFGYRTKKCKICKKKLNIIDKINTIHPNICRKCTEVILFYQAIQSYNQHKRKEQLHRKEVIDYANKHKLIK